MCLGVSYYPAGRTIRRVRVPTALSGGDSTRRVSRDAPSTVLTGISRTAPSVTGGCALLAARRDCGGPTARVRSTSQQLGVWTARLFPTSRRRRSLDCRERKTLGFVPRAISISRERDARRWTLVRFETRRITFVLSFPMRRRLRRR